MTAELHNMFSNSRKVNFEKKERQYYLTELHDVHQKGSVEKTSLSNHDQICLYLGYSESLLVVQGQQLNVL